MTATATYRLSTLIAFIFFSSSCTEKISTDVLIAGGGTGGTAAGIQSARMGVNTLITEESGWLGGMLTSAGVSAADGNFNLKGGIWKEFRDSLSDYYGGDSLLKTGWVSNVMFEPSVGSLVFRNIARAEPMLKVMFNSVVTHVRQTSGGWRVKVKVEAQTEVKTYIVEAKVLIDATELGDIAAMCGAPYDVGMDSRYETGEEIAPEEENDIIQDLTYVAVLKDFGHDVSMPEPEGYDPSAFACCCDNSLCKTPDEENRLWPCGTMISYGKLPHNKYMINWPISGNDYYLNLIEMSREERAAALQVAKTHTFCFIYFLQHELGLNTLGLADDEFPTYDRLPFIPYYRESRRIHGKIRFTLNHITDPYKQNEKLYRTCIAVGDYPVDHHHSAYSGKETLPDLHFYPVPSYGLPLGVLVPEDIEGLIVAEKSISVTNIVNGTTRLQPVVLQLGQAAGVLAALSVKHEKAPEEISVREVQKVILGAGGYLLPYLDVPVGHEWFTPIQRVGSTGIMKGEGRSEGWTNQTFFRAYEPLKLSELEGLKDIYSIQDMEFTDAQVTVGEAVEIVRRIAVENDYEAVDEKISMALKLFNSVAVDNRIILRGEMALLLDMVLDPFNRYMVDIRGDFIHEDTSG